MLYKCLNVKVTKYINILDVSQYGKYFKTKGMLCNPNECYRPIHWYLV